MARDEEKNKKTVDADWGALPDKAVFRRRGLHINIVGDEGSGKSSLAMTIARLGKVGYIDIDGSAERAKRPDDVDWARDVRVLPVTYAVGLTEEEVKRRCTEAWDNMKRKVTESFSWARAHIIDTDTELWELMRLKSFGKQSGQGRRMDRVYGPVNAEFRTFLRNIYRAQGRHLVTIAQNKDEYADRTNASGELVSIKTGRRERVGFKEIPYLADLILETFKDSGTFKVRVRTNKLPPIGPMLEGSEYEGDEYDLAYIIALSTETDPKDWR